MKTAFLAILSLVCVATSIGWINSSNKLARLESLRQTRAQVEEAAENLRQEYLGATPAIQRAIDISTNGIASHIGTDVDIAITEAKFGNPTNALVAIHNASMELDDIIVLFKPAESSN